MSEIFIRRPVMTTLIACGLLFFGVVSYRALPNSDLPNVAYPTIVVSAALPGADPGQMASSVASPLERQLTTINGLNSMVSVNTTGSTQITLQFDLSRDIDGAAGDVQAMIAKASGDLPNNLPMPPYYQKVNPADMPVLWLTVASPTLPISKVND